MALESLTLFYLEYLSQAGDAVSTRSIWHTCITIRPTIIQYKKFHFNEEVINVSWISSSVLWKFHLHLCYFLRLQSQSGVSTVQLYNAVSTFDHLYGFHTPDIPCWSSRRLSTCIFFSFEKLTFTT